MKRAAGYLVLAVILDFAVDGGGEDPSKATVQNLLKDLTGADYEKARAASAMPL